MKSRFFIETMGCQMNKNDSERIAGLLIKIGMEKTETVRQADLLIINSCSVRQPAEDRVCGIVKNWTKYKLSNPNLIIAVTGCMPGRDRQGKISRKIKNADLFFSIDELPMLPKWLHELNPNLGINGFDASYSDYLLINPERTNGYSAFITIQTGCNNFCSYCVVPYARGRERNRPVKEIMREANNFAANGGLELVLLGQVVNHYIAPDPQNFSVGNPFAGEDDFAALLWELNKIQGVNRIHYTAPHPQYFNQAQINSLALSKLVNYLHLPAQSGDNDILRKMNRKYTHEQYVNLIREIRKMQPDIAIGTDLIIGFPGESEDQFMNTLRLYEECEFDIAYIGIYSERSGTIAAGTLEDNVPREIKKRRWNDVQNYMEKHLLIKNQRYAGREVEVLVSSCDENICSGNSREMKLVQFVGSPDLIGGIVKVKIFEAKEWVLKGEKV